MRGRKSRMCVVEGIKTGRGSGSGGGEVASEAGSFAKSSRRVGKTSMGRRVCGGRCCCGDGHDGQSGRVDLGVLRPDRYRKLLGAGARVQGAGQ